MTAPAPSDARAAAFTLVELLVAVAVLVLLTSVSFPNLVRFYETQKLRQAAVELQSQLLRGRTLARRLQSPCRLAISNGANGATVQVTAPSTVLVNNIAINNACASTNLSTLNLTTEVGVRGLCVRDTDGGPSTCTAPAAIDFVPLGVLVGAPRTLYISGTATTQQFCVDLNLTLLRLGFRNATSGACTYTSS